MENEEKSPRQLRREERAGFTGDDNFSFQRHKQQHTLGGIIIILIGLGLLFRQLFPGIFPPWLFTWPMILIVGGLFIFLKNGFGGLIPILIGIFFLIKDEISFSHPDLSNYILPVIVIFIGFIFILKRNHHHRGCHRGKLRDNKSRYFDNSDEDYIDVNSVFGSAEKSMFTKSFKGGNINCAFGGGKINLTQADIEDRAVLNISVAFGGAEITVPANWQIQNDLTAIFGGIEDQRRLISSSDKSKTLVLRGGIFCGGVEIKN